MMHAMPVPLPLILCMKWGTRYRAEYVNQLYHAVARGMGGQQFQFICFTEDVTGLVPAVEARPLPPLPQVPPHLANKPWRKLSLWQADLGEDLVGRDALVLDLDLLITGALQSFFTHAPGCPFVVWRNPTKPLSGVGNTSVFRFKVGSHPEIYQRFIDNPEGVWRQEFRIEQELIAARLGDGTATRTTALSAATRADPFYAGLKLMEFWPVGWVVSFKEDLLPPWPQRLWQRVPLPTSARVVVFHGKPDPDEALLGHWPAPWYKKVYKTLRPVRWIAQFWQSPVGE
jgi:hypothetical protein